MLILPSTVSIRDSYRHSTTRNTQLVAWLYATAACIGGDMRYAARRMYIEFENTASPGDPVTVPTVDPLDASHGRPYYVDLSGDRDYLRVPIQGSPSFSASDTYAAYFATGEGNRVRLAAMADTGVGEHGVPFASGSNSTVCGVAIVASPVDSDPSRDLVLARAYYDTDEQIVLAGSPIEAVWEAALWLPGDNV